MKTATLISLPLAVSGAAVPLVASGAVGLPVMKRDGAAPSNSSGILGSLSFNDIPKPIRGAAGDLLKSNLPGFVQWGATNLAWLMRWANPPIAEFTLEPTLSKDAKKKIIRYGPFTIKGANDTSETWQPFWQMDKSSSWFLRTLEGFPDNAVILSAKPIFSYKDGSKASFDTGIYAHHILVADLSKRTAPFALCPNMHKEDNFDDWVAGYAMDAVGAGLIQVGNDAIGAANVYTPEGGKIKAGFKTGTKDIIGFQGELVNYKPQAQDIYIDMELEYLPQHDDSYIDASTIVLSAMGCKNPDYESPTGKNQTETLSENFDITQTGYVVNARGHLHDGGTSIDLILNGKNVCSSKPKYGRTKDAQPDDPETIVDMSWCHGPIPIKPGDILNVKTAYDITLHPLRKSSGGMGHGMHMRRDGGHGAHGDGSMGASEMGIMTTNFAWSDSPKVDDTTDGKGRAQGGLFEWAKSWWNGKDDKKPAAAAPAAPAAAPSAAAPAPAAPAPAVPAPEKAEEPKPSEAAAPAPAPAAPAGDGHAHSH